MYRDKRYGERGSAGSKFLIVLVSIFLLAHAGYNYIPVAYEGESFKQEMQTAITQATAMPGINMGPNDVVKAKLNNLLKAYDLPKNTVVEVKVNGNALTARVRYTREVNILPFGFYKKLYEFDYTATPTGFLSKSLNS